MASGPASGGPPLAGGAPILSEPAQGTLAVNGTMARYVNNNIFACATGDTVLPGTPTSGVILLNPAAAVTGIILGVGLFDGQEIILINVSNFAITFAASGTSNIADGTGDVIAALLGERFVWSALKALWYHV